MRQLLAFRLERGAALEGHLLGALERIESGGALRVLDVLFVGRDAENGELFAAKASGRAGGGLITLLDLRLDRRKWAAATRKALSAYDRGGEANPLEQLAARLEPGAALAVVLVEHAWRGVVDDAARRSGGACVLDERVGETAIADLGPALIAALDGAEAPAEG